MKAQSRWIAPAATPIRTGDRDLMGGLRCRKELERALGAGFVQEMRSDAGRRWTTLTWSCGCRAEESVTDWYHLERCLAHRGR